MSHKDDLLRAAERIEVDCLIDDIDRQSCMALASRLRAAAEGCVVVERSFLADLVSLYECRIHWGKALEKLKELAAAQGESRE